MKRTLLFILLFLTFGCGKSDKLDSPETASPTIKESKPAFKHKIDPFSLPKNLKSSSIVITEMMRRHVTYFVGNDPLKIPLHIESASHEELSVNILGCWANGGSYTQEMDLWCSAASISKEFLTISVPDELEPSYQKNESLKMVFEIGVEEVDSIDSVNFFLAPTLYNVRGVEIDVIDRQYKKKELDDLPQNFKTILSQVAANGGSSLFNQKSTGGFGGAFSTSWYLGSDGDHHYMVTAEHVRSNRKFVFPYSSVTGKAGDVVFKSRKRDFAIFTANLDGEESDIKALREMPIDLNYVPVENSPLKHIGFAALNTPYFLPNVDEGPWCRIIESETQNYTIGHREVLGYQTGCLGRPGDSGGVFIDATTNRVVSLISSGSSPLDIRYMANSGGLLDALADKTEFGDHLIPFAMVALEMKRDFKEIPEEYRQYIKDRFNL